MRHPVKLWPIFLTTAFFILSGSAYGHDNMELRMIKVVNGNGPYIYATARAALSPDGRMSFDKKNNMLVVFDRPDYLPHIEELVRVLDVKAPRVEISVRIAEVNSQFLKRSGIYSSQLIFPKGSFDAVADLLNTRTDSFTRAKTAINAQNGIPAQLQVKSEEIFSIPGGFIDVLPMVNSDKTITVKLMPSRSGVEEGESRSESAVLTQVTLHSGDTVAIGRVELLVNPQGASGRRVPMIFLTVNIIQ
ncbi:MAG: secretin N-terminal domain-containing protein [Candidatus Omnitrophota bacterium]